MQEMKAEPHGRFRPLPLEAVTLLEEGRIPEAVKSVRESHRLRLRDARDWVDAYIAGEPLLRVKLETERAARRRRVFWIFLVMDAVVAAAIIWWFL